MWTRRTLFAVATLAALAGCATPSRPVPVADAIAAQTELTTLNRLIVKAGLSDTLRGAGPFTVFAPSNQAFARIPAQTLDALAKDPAKLKAVLSYHVLPGNLKAADIKNGNSKTVNGASVALSRAGDFVTVEDALVQTPDIAASNGVIHIVDSVLMPPAGK
ncbi:MAG: fasciclin domain-containing protein [Polaromonas sp.]